MPTLTIPTPLRPYTQGTKNIDLNSTDVRGAVQEIALKFPALDPHLFTEDGNLRPYVNLFVNDEDVRHLQGLETKLGDKDLLRIIPSIAGGNNNLLI